jgi:hypothetical protein
LCPGKTTSHTLYISSNFEKNDVIPKKRVKIPKYTPAQLVATDQKVIVKDDAKYFTFSQSTLTEMDGFSTDDVENTSDTTKNTKLLASLSQKFWCAISDV